VSVTAARKITCTEAELADRGAATVVAEHRDRLPDLRDAVVLIPDLHAVSGIAHALRRAAGVPALLLPRITTLAAWAESVPLAHKVAAPSLRAVTLYEALAGREWLKGADLWALARELGGLFDEMIRHNVALAENLGDFATRLEAAYQARPSTALKFEAQLVHELWWAMSRDADQLAPEAAYQLRLARLAQDAHLPLYAIGLTGLAPAEREFLDRYAQRAPVTVVEARPGDDAVSALLAAAWPEAPDADLRVRAQRLKLSHPAGSVITRIRVHAAASAEQEAQAIDVAVRTWRLAGRKSIAVVVQDRVVARRARALLERAAVLVSDEAGWALSTTSAATALGRWLDVVANDAYHQDLLDLLKSPFALHDMPRDARRHAVWRLERYVRDANVIAGLSNFAEIARRQGDAEVTAVIERVAAAVSALTTNRKPLAAWLAALDESLARIGVRAGLAADAAGEELLDLLSHLARELKDNRTLLTFAQWRRWLAGELEASTFRDRAVDSPVIFTYLAATRLRRFDAVLVCGCDAQHLPGPDPVFRFFNHAVRAELGLPTREAAVREMQSQLAALIATGGEVLFTWQRQLAGEDNLFSPLLERINVVHALAYGGELAPADIELVGAEVASPDAASLPAPAPAPHPGARVQLLPREFSASAYNSLIACPYQYYASYLLKLAELDEVQELIDKRDFGSLLHGVLAKFHQSFPALDGHSDDEAARALEAISEAAFRDAIADNYLARAWLLQWKALIPEYLQWQREREDKGWRWHAGEAKRSLDITTPKGLELTVIGRLDRIDVDGTGAASVVDYKTGSAQMLRRKADGSGEDVQLPVYAMLWNGKVAQACFLALERNGVGEVVQKELDVLVAANRDRIAALYDMLREGAAMPAHGTEAVCEYCTARGLCRKDHWL
jgi:ATP-dependent helicase/nuclease subunit B